MAIIFEIISGSLPPGLTGVGVGAQFQISGTPTTPGDFSFRLRATNDETGTFSEKDYTLNALAIDAAALPDATINQEYVGAPSIIGSPLGGVTWSATGLPAGLSIDPATGVISGTPTEEGSFQVTPNFVDSSGDCTAVVEGGGGTVDINVNPAGACVIDNDSDLGTVPYAEITSFQFTQTGLAGAVTWLAGGPFPFGQAMFPDTGEWLVLPNEGFVGEHIFTVQVSEDADPTNNCSKQFSITIDCPIDSPTGGQTASDPLFFESIGNLQWENSLFNTNGTISMAGGDGTFSLNDAGSSNVLSYGALCVPGLGYEIEYTLSGTVAFSAALADPDSGATVGIQINDADGLLVLDDSATVTTDGNINLNNTFMLDSKTFYQIRVFGNIVIDSGDAGKTGSLSGGLITLRPLTPP